MIFVFMFLFLFVPAVAYYYFFRLFRVCGRSFFERFENLSGVAFELHLIFPFISHVCVERERERDRGSS